MNFWKLIYRITWIVLGVIGLAVVILLSAPKWHEYQTLQARRAEELQRAREREELIKTYKDMQERFRNDPRFVVQVAHDLGMARPDEIMFKFADRPLTGRDPAPTNAAPLNLRLPPVSPPPARRSN